MVEQIIVIITSILIFLFVWILSYLKTRRTTWDNYDWARVKSPYEADPRDFRVENVVGEPSKEDLEKLPERVYLFEKIDQTINQWCLNCCTSAALSNIMNILQNLDYWVSKEVKINCCDLRQNMGHWCKCPDRWDYLENALKTLKKYWVKWSIDWHDKIFAIEGYAYKPFAATDDHIKLIKYYLYKWYPIYFATLWNRQVWQEMQQWELKTIINPEQATWGHALVIGGVDKDYVYIINSRTPNYNWISLFKISIPKFKEAIQKWMFFWRWFIVYDKIDVKEQLFPDFNFAKDTEQYKAVKWAKENWIVKWVQHGDWKYYLEPYRPLTRLEFILMLYRYNQLKKDS